MLAIGLLGVFDFTFLQERVVFLALFHLLTVDLALPRMSAAAMSSQLLAHLKRPGTERAMIKPIISHVERIFSLSHNRCLVVLISLITSLTSYASAYLIRHIVIIFVVVIFRVVFFLLFLFIIEIAL